MKPSQKKKVLILKGEEEARIEEVEAKKNSPRSTLTSSLFEATEVGFSVALPIVGGALFGLWLDGKFGTHPKLTLGFLTLGFTIAIIHIAKLIKDFSKKDTTS